MTRRKAVNPSFGGSCDDLTPGQLVSVDVKEVKAAIKMLEINEVPEDARVLESFRFIGDAE